MIPEELKIEAAEEMTKWQKHKFFLLVIAVLVISMVMVAISLHLYNSSGAAQVDVSLPGYKSIQKQASKERSDSSFPATGTLDKEAFDSFDKLYGKHIDQINSSESFDSRALSEDSLQMMVAPDPATQSEIAN